MSCVSGIFVEDTSSSYQYLHDSLPLGTRQQAFIKALLLLFKVIADHIKHKIKGG